ncbi:MAG: hypothetical protein J6S67_26045 [Methanobrevibacter sp.]|nr:hypothetical protein [Methanobrevibacter sp.]
MIDVLYIKGPCSQNYDEEMKYSLRSLEKYVSDYGRVFITGDRPLFVNKDKVVHTLEQDIGVPTINHWWKVRQTIKNTDISQRFVLMYDDIFFVKPTKLENYPAYHKGKLEDKTFEGFYRKSCGMAYYWLNEHGYETKDYELHIPFVYDRDKFLELDKIFDKIKDKQDGMVVRSIYGNMFESDSPLRKDIKIRKSDVGVEQVIGDADCFSVSDWVFCNNVHPWLKAHFKERSIFEK